MPKKIKKFFSYSENDMTSPPLINEKSSCNPTRWVYIRNDVRLKKEAVGPALSPTFWRVKLSRLEIVVFILLRHFLLPYKQCEQPTHLSALAHTKLDVYL